MYIYAGSSNVDTSSGVVARANDATPDYVSALWQLDYALSPPQWTKISLGNYSCPANYTGLTGQLNPPPMRYGHTMAIFQDTVYGTGTRVRHRPPPSALPPPPVASSGERRLPVRAAGDLWGCRAGGFTGVQCRLVPDAQRPDRDLPQLDQHPELHLVPGPLDRRPLPRFPPL